MNAQAFCAFSSSMLDLVQLCGLHEFNLNGQRTGCLLVDCRFLIRPYLKIDLPMSAPLKIWTGRVSEEGVAEPCRADPGPHVHGMVSQHRGKAIYTFPEVITSF